MNIFFDGTLEESSERQVRETTPGVIEKSSSIAKPISGKYEKDVEALRKKYGENFKTGFCIEVIFAYSGGYPFSISGDIRSVPS